MLNHVLFWHALWRVGVFTQEFALAMERGDSTLKLGGTGGGQHSLSNMGVFNANTGLNNFWVSTDCDKNVRQGF